MNVRLKEVGLPKKDLATLLGKAPTQVSQMGRESPVPIYVQAIVEAWYLLSGPNRERLLALMESEAE
ncbi:MAG: hypothetical protein ACR2RF_26270 [Geminicoccaceae bacterium]